MASMKAERPPVKTNEGAPKAPASKPAPKKAEQKPREPKKKVYTYVHAMHGYDGCDFSLQIADVVVFFFFVLLLIYANFFLRLETEDCNSSLGHLVQTGSLGWFWSL
uniref:Uncharacterized protein n=1 Tax=Nelumbo nucifera TaxID=4432 RepID=A0A822YUV8_NELNU|nr:TPA_asm: hypothetical protein HUJ06_005849 [Nelumbo nucifera]